MSCAPARVAAVILAAGQSRRFGRPNSKVVAELEGVPLVRIVATTALRSRVVSVTVVSGHDSTKIDMALKGLNLRIVHNAAFASGMASSLKAGLAALPTDVDGMLVMLADMPLVQPSTLDALIGHFDQRREALDAVVPTFKQTRGNPALIGSRLFPALRLLQGDKGASRLFSLSHSEIEYCEVDDPGITIDIDTEADLDDHCHPPATSFARGRSDP